MPNAINDQHIRGRRQRASSAARIDVTNPANEEWLGSIPDADAADVDQAVRAAQAAYDSSEWTKTTAAERADMLVRLAEALERRADDIGDIVTRQNGMPVWTIGGRQGHAVGAASAYRYFADLAKTFPFEEVRETGTSRTLVRREPIGVAGIIAPWNGPQQLVSWKLGPALAAGCTAVIKPAPETSLDAFMLLDAVVEAGFPAGVVNLITGGRDTGKVLVEHPGINKIGFTGSTAAGRAIAEQCGAALKPVTLELGGKSAAILLEDADLDLFRSKLPRICLPNSGQVCYSHTRVLAPVSRYEEVVEAIVETVRTGLVGDPLSEDTTYGPLIAERQRSRVEGYIAEGKQEGAQIVQGGGRPSHLAHGYFVEPTVFTDVNMSMRIAQEEIFGPVLAIIPYGTEQDAVRLANASAYGLGGTVFTADPQRGVEVARQVQTGTIGINGYALSYDSPFGGYKNSGLGRELGPEGLAAYLQYKSIYDAPKGRP